MLQCPLSLTSTHDANYFFNCHQVPTHHATSLWKKSLKAAGIIQSGNRVWLPLGVKEWLLLDSLREGATTTMQSSTKLITTMFIKHLSLLRFFLFINIYLNYSFTLAYLCFNDIHKRFL